MVRFRYVAKDMTGKLYKGLADAASETALSASLREQQLFLVQAKSISEKKGHYKLKPKQLASFCKEMSTLLASGIALVRALEIVASQEGISPREMAVYQAVLQDLRKGTALSDAMEATKSFPTLMIGMIRSGEGNGNIDMTMERLAVQYEKDYKLTQQVRSAMTYPTVLLVLCVIIVILIVTFILPQFQSLFDQMDSLPWVTNVLISFSDFLVQKWYIAILAVFTFVMIIRVVAAVPLVRRELDYLKVRLPGFGKLFKVIYSARFARTLSSLYSSGMPISGAISIAGKTIGNSYVEEQFDKVVFNVRSGIPLSQALKGVDGMINKLSSTIMIGEESGRLDTMLDSIALSLEDEAEEATKRMVTLLEPILIIFMAVIVGFIMIAVMLPIYQSYAAIENA